MFLADNLNKGAGAASYQISRSLRFNSADSASLTRTPASNINRKTFTFSYWAKLSSLITSQISMFGSRGSPTVTRGEFGTYANKLFIQDYSGSAWVIDLSTTAVFRDPSAWYHIVYSVDTTQATDTNRVKLFVNGVQQTLSGTFPTQNLDTDFLITTATSYIGFDGGGSSATYFGGYMADFYLIDGQQLTPSSFGQTDAQTGVWGPKAYSGSYGTNGFYLNFSDNSNTTAATLGKDYSGNGNNWTPNNFSVAAGAGNDSLVDSPTSYGTDTGVGGEVRGNYSTLNPLNNVSTISNGNLDSTNATAAWKPTMATMGISSGKWYWEITPTAITDSVMIGIAPPTFTATSGEYPGTGVSGGYGYYSANGNLYPKGAAISYGASYVANNVIGVALDMDAGTLVFYKNGTSQGTAATGLTGTWLPAAAVYQASYSANFGQRPFAYTAPSGYKALCTQNLPTPTIGATTATQAGKFFNPVLYTGNGGTLAVTGVNFQPDLVWTHARDTGFTNVMTDAVRGVGKSIYSNNTDPEVTNDPNGYLSVFGSDGFTVTAGSSSALRINSNGSPYVAWNWKANGSGSSNTAGSITSTVSANTTSGFSVVTYSGTSVAGTIGHGLGVAPSMIIVKNRNGSPSVPNWRVYHASLGATKYIELNSSGAANTFTDWNNTAPTSTVFSVGADGTFFPNNQSGYNYVAYCFAEVAGYSKFGSYTGNGSSDGPFIYCGFRPAYVMVKLSSSTGDWLVEDGTRNPYNVVDAKLSPNTSGAEYASASAVGIDFLSNGFKIRGTDTAINSVTNTFIFAAFATSPFKYALAR